MSANQIRAAGIVVELMGRDACRVELPNGHRCIARAPRGSAVSVDDRVTVEFHPYDLSRGWIVPPAAN
jgi:translation initiation factor IF-1